MTVALFKKTSKNKKVSPGSLSHQNVIFLKVTPTLFKTLFVLLQLNAVTL